MLVLNSDVRAKVLFKKAPYEIEIPLNSGVCWCWIWFETMYRSL